MISAIVVPMQTTYKDGRRSLVAAGASESTDDLGQFRLSGLPPGSYYVQVRKALTGMPAGAVVSSSLMFVPGYAPGTPNAADARRVTVNLGRTVSGVDVVIARFRTASIAGMFVDADGQPARDGQVFLIQPGQPNPDAPWADVGLNPTINLGFSFMAVPSGRYELRAIANGAISTVAAGTRPLAAIAAVTVNGENITDVRLTPIRIATVTGRVIVDPEVASLLPISSIGISARSTDPTDPPGWVAESRGVALARDLTFTLRALPGRWIFTPSSPQERGNTPSLPKGWGLKAVRLQGVDVTDTGIEVHEGVDVCDVEVELTNRPPQVSGTVRGSKGEAADDYTVLLFARDRARWNGNPRYFAMARPDQTGKFTVSTLAPGEYYAIALEYVDVNEAQDPELLDRASRNATPFTLGESEQKTLDLRLTP